MELEASEQRTQCVLRQQSPTFLAPGTGLAVDNFSTDVVVGDGSGGNASDGERQMKLCWLARHSPPAMQHSSEQAADQYPTEARGWGPLC